MKAKTWERTLHRDGYATGAHLLRAALRPRQDEISPLLAKLHTVAELRSTEQRARVVARSIRHSKRATVEYSLVEVYSRSTANAWNQT